MKLLQIENIYCESIFEVVFGYIGGIQCITHRMEKQGQNRLMSGFSFSVFKEHNNFHDFDTPVMDFWCLIPQV